MTETVKIALPFSFEVQCIGPYEEKPKKRRFVESREFEIPVLATDAVPVVLRYSLFRGIAGNRISIRHSEGAFYASSFDGSAPLSMTKLRWPIGGNFRAGDLARYLASKNEAQITKWFEGDTNVKSIFGQSLTMLDDGREVAERELSRKASGLAFIDGVLHYRIHEPMIRIRPHVTERAEIILDGYAGQTERQRDLIDDLWLNVAARDDLVTELDAPWLGLVFDGLEVLDKTAFTFDEVGDVARRLAVQVLQAKRDDLPLSEQHAVASWLDLRDSLGESGNTTAETIMCKVYAVFESFPDTPALIRRITEFNETCRLMGVGIVPHSGVSGPKRSATGPMP